MLEEIKTRRAAITQRAWPQELGAFGGHNFHAIGPLTDDLRQAIADQTFMRHARGDIDWLIARVERLETALREIRTHAVFIGSLDAALETLTAISRCARAALEENDGRPESP